MLLFKFALALGFLTTVVWSTSDDGFCSNVVQMHRHCMKQGTIVPDVRRGKAGPRGHKGEKGSPGTVDYDAIDETITRKVADIAATFNAKLQQHQEKIKRLEQKLASITVTDCGKVDIEDAKSNSGNGGIFDIYLGKKKTEIYCDLTTDGGDWMVIQRRRDGSVNFHRGWKDYVNGFGQKDAEFWLGLETMHQFTSIGKYELRVDLEDWEGNKRYAKYSTFTIGDAASNYKMTIGGYSGTAGDSMSRESGRAFSTKDADHDTYKDNCAALYKGAWWYGACHEANLNGFYYKGGKHSSYADGVNWRKWKEYHYSMKFVEMKIRPAR